MRLYLLRVCVLECNFFAIRRIFGTYCCDTQTACYTLVRLSYTKMNECNSLIVTECMCATPQRMPRLKIVSPTDRIEKNLIIDQLTSIQNLGLRGESKKLLICSLYFSVGFFFVFKSRMQTFSNSSV